MHVARVEIRNIKGFGDGEDGVDLDLTDGGRINNLAGWTVFAGANGSGKTTLLRAMAVAIDGQTASGIAFERVPDWIHAGCAEGSVRIELERFHVVTDATTPEPFARRAPPLAANARWLREEKIWRNSLDDLPPFITEGPLNLVSFMAAYGPTRRVVGRLDDVTALMQSHAHRSAGLFREDAYLAESVQWLQRLDYQRLSGDADAERLLELTLRLLNDALLPGDFHMLGVSPTGLRVRHRGTELSLQSLSDGYRTTAALVLDLVSQVANQVSRGAPLEQRPDGRVIVPHPGVVFIDEMELHLHPSWQKRIGFWLKEHFPWTQFLVTTHSPFICQAADTLVRLSPPGQGQPVAEIVDEETHRRVVTGGADDAVVSSLFGLEYPHSDQAERARERLAILEVREFDGTLNEEEPQELERLRRAFPETATAAVERALRKVAAVS
ncbi:ATP-binding protein [Chondromyces apiculatus]|uniref:ATPase AAA-type core domain-containing protein n=1 Tax=Chondromyces apiculatus DSM 436 TaxID=1192034 RepID=A0A017T377_9BACT|nr:ATP-binding protein [Chondromyces apiculatus]EYF02996.1 Hypothetical protein CAP_6258 [Chondromyces apiculatus DSM 436]